MSAHFTPVATATVVSGRSESDHRQARFKLRTGGVTTPATTVGGVADERVYRIGVGRAETAEPVSLAAVGLKERQDLQEWVLANPEILGAGVKIVTLEFDRWQTTSGERQLDRLDVLGLDEQGTLVLAELKRDRAPDTVQMQAIKYAAFASRFTPSDLAAYHHRFLQSQGTSITEDEALQSLVEHAGELDSETLRRPRIVIVAGAYTPATTATVVWLTEMGLDITLQQAQAYRIANEQLILTVSQVFPLTDVEDFTVSPLRAEVRAAKERERGVREKSTVARLIAAGTLEDGTELTLRPTNEITPDARDLVTEWVAEDESRGTATWSNDPTQPLTWAHDGGKYRPTSIVSKVLREAAGIERSARGPSWWVTPDGVDLTQLAGSLAATRFDWSGLHELLHKIPQGKWTTYGDLAERIGTAPQPLGTHIAGCANCVNAHRVLAGQGEEASGFRWTDPQRTDTQQDALEGEGVEFVGNRANPEQRVRLRDLG